MLPARAVAGGLDVEAVIDSTHDDLLLAHRPHAGAWRAQEPASHYRGRCPGAMSAKLRRTERLGLPSHDRR